MLKKFQTMPPNTDPFIFKRGVLIGVAGLLIIGTYALYAALPYLSGPSLEVTETTQNGGTVISGKTARVSFLTIDGMPIPLQEDGSFSAERAYPLGYTAVQVSVKDQFGRTLTKMLTFVNK